MTEIIWIAKHRDEINEWFLKESGVFSVGLDNVKGVRENGLVWYESFITNYVARHSKSFRRDSPEYIWYELNLGDTRTYAKSKGRSKPDLLLQFPDEIWIVEVKYYEYSPNLTTNYAKDCIEQIESYEKELIQLMESGWFPNRKIKLAVFWAFWSFRKRTLPTDPEYQKWPIDREKRTD